MSLSAVLDVLRWCLAHPREALAALLAGGWRLLVETAEIAEMFDGLARESVVEPCAGCERHEWYIGRPLFAVRVSDGWRVN